MKLFLLSYGPIEFDGRLRELIEVSKLLGETHVISRNYGEKKSFHQRMINYSYFYFVIYCFLRIIREKNNVNAVFIDNRKAVVPAILIRLFLRDKLYILDVRELYIKSDNDSLSRRLGNFFESFLIKRANVVLSANKFRSKIMMDYYNLKVEPIVFENIRQLEYSKDIDLTLFRNKYKSMLERETFKIISTSGHSISRTNDILVRCMEELGDKFELLLVGGGSNKDKDIINKIIVEKDLKNVSFIKNIKMNELKYLIQSCQLGIVNYHSNDMNNKYCASGKIFEFVFEGLPVVTTENEPLVDLVSKYRIGIADNDYINGIKEVYNNYKYFVSNVNDYKSSLDVIENNKMTAQLIHSRILQSKNNKGDKF